MNISGFGFLVSGFGKRTANRLVGRLFFVLLALLPTFAFAGEEKVELKFTSSDMYFLYASLLLALISVLVGFLIARWVNSQSPGTERMQEVGAAIKDGALA